LDSIEHITCPSHAHVSSNKRHNKIIIDSSTQQTNKQLYTTNNSLHFILHKDSGVGVGVEGHGVEGWGLWWRGVTGGDLLVP
jgi:hypothetical protein